MLINMAEKNGGGCPGPNDRLDREQTDKRLKGLQPAWRIEEGHHLAAEWKFKNFKKALAFTNRIGDVAEGMGHHPDLELGWGRVAATLFSHSAGGLTENDFVLAAKIDGLVKG